MEKSKIMSLTFTMLFATGLQSVLSNQICYRLKYLNPICKSDNIGFTKYKPVYKSSINEQIKYVGPSINVIHNYAFVEYNDNMRFGKYIKNLVLDLSNADIIIEPSAIALTQLERLEINSGPVQLELGSFQNLSNLQHLKIKVNEKSAKIGQVLKNLPRLNSLELLDHYNIDICESSTNILEIITLRLIGGFIWSISSQSFECLTNLKELTITKTSLSMIEPGAFDSLENLVRVSITSNNKLNIIPANIFSNLKDLKVLDLEDNSISKLDNTYFSMNKNCKLLNLSYNSIESIQNGSFKNIGCTTLDLGGNKITHIGDDEFTDSMITTILLDDNIITDFIDDKKWGIDSKKTTVYFNYDYIDFAISNNEEKTQSFNCYESTRNYFKICQEKNRVVTVTGRAMAHRLSQETLVFVNTDIILTEDYTFHNLTIKTLIIESTAKPFQLFDKSLKGLLKLENLQLDTQPISVQNTTFFHVKNTLQRLSLSVNESEIFLCNSLQEVKNLISLTIVNHDTFNFCNEICYNKTEKYGLKYLHYNKGSFKTVQSNAFSCLKNLRYLFIDRTHITELGFDAFNGVQSLVTLLLQYNRNLTHIKKNSFGPMRNLESLMLRSNSLEFIEDGAFLKLNNHLSLLDLSRNKLRAISDKTFEGIKSIERLDLSNNDIVNFFYDENLISLVYIYNNSQLFSVNGSEKLQVELFCHLENWWIICTNGTIITSITFGQFNSTLEISDAEKDNLQIEISIDNITSIRDDAWKYIDSQLTIKSLILKKNIRDGFELSANSFNGLSELENLELNVGLTNLERGAFYRLSKLNRLKIEVNETKEYLGKSLLNLRSLTSLNIVKNKSISICGNEYSQRLPPIVYLSYIKGRFTVLHKNSFTCLPSLEYLRVTKTNLTTIEPGAFLRLDLLEKIDLSYNKIKRIVMNVFNSLKVLKILRLNNNEIIGFDMGSLITINNNYTLINVSHNNIVEVPDKTFGNLVCKVFDIKKNPLRSSTKTIMGSPANIGKLIDRLGRPNHPGQHFKATDDDEPQREYYSWMSNGKDCHGSHILFGAKYKSTCRKVGPFSAV